MFASIPYFVKCLYNGIIVISEGMGVNKNSASKEYDIFHYWYFLIFRFKFQPNAGNTCRDLLMMPMNLIGNAGWMSV